MNFILSLSLFIFWITALILILVSIYSIYSFFYCQSGNFPPFVPAMGTAKQKALNEARHLIKTKLDKKWVISDLGCGIGSLLLPLAKEFPNCEFYGYEWEKYVAFIAKWRGKNLKNYHIYQQDFMKASFEKTDIAFIYATIGIPMKKLGEKLNQEMPSNSLIISVIGELNGPLTCLKKEKSSALFSFGNFCVYRTKR